MWRLAPPLCHASNHSSHWHADRTTLENRLKHYREKRGWSQGEMARRLGVSRQTINAVETDKYDPSLPLALRMARLFGVAVPELFIDHWEPEE